MRIKVGEKSGHGWHPRRALHQIVCATGVQVVDGQIHNFSIGDFLLLKTALKGVLWNDLLRPAHFFLCHMAIGLAFL